MPEGEFQGLFGNIFPLFGPNSPRAEERRFEAARFAEIDAERRAEAQRQIRRGERISSIRESLPPNIGPDAAKQVGNQLLSDVPSLQQLGVQNLNDIQARLQGEDFVQAAPLSRLDQADLERVNAVTSLSNMQLEGLPLIRKQALEKATREIRASDMKLLGDFQKGIQGNQVLSQGKNMLDRGVQLIQTLNDPRAGQLEISTAAVLFSQLIEEGLAVRTDDRLAFAQGSSSGLQQLVNSIHNLYDASAADVEPTRKNVTRAIENLIKPVLPGFLEARQFWMQHAQQTEGLNPNAVDQLLGLTQGHGLFIEELMAEDIAGAN